MRIALVTDTYVPQVNGVTTVVRRIAEALREAGHHVAIIAPAYPEGHPPNPVDELRIPSAPFPPYPAIRLSLPRSRYISRFLDRFAPDVVHVCTEGPLGLVGRRYALERRTALVTSAHTDFPQYCRYYGVPVLASLMWRWLGWFHRPAALTHTPGTAMRDELAAHGVPQPVIWGCGVDTRLFSPERRAGSLRRMLGADIDQVIVLHVGRLAPEKNLAVLSTAFTLARETLAGRAVFVIAGDGPEAAGLEAALPWIRRTGFLERGELAILYASADLCVLPSCTETCGLVALEAMASRLPVVAADAGGFRDSIEPEHTGLLVPPDQPHAFAAAIARLSLAHHERHRLGEAARAFALTRDARDENAALLVQYGALAHAQRSETWAAA